MPNFLTDNADLRFYVERYIDWDTLFDHAEFGRTDGHSNGAEARSFYLDVLDLVGEFTANEIAPHWQELDKAPMALVDGEVQMGKRLDDIFAQMGAMGLHGLSVPRDLGGMGCPMMVYVLVSELIARGDVSVMTHFGFHGGVAMALLMYASEEGSVSYDAASKTLTDCRFKAVIEDIVTGNAWGSMDITEPDAGSDMGALRTRAVQDEDGDWFVTGQKIFVTSGHGRYHIVVARTEPEESGLDGLSLFLVETYEEAADGIRERRAGIERVEGKIGHHASATVTINFDRTPAQLLGQRGEGFRLMLLLMNNARIAVGFESLGVAEAAFRLARDYAAERHSMGKTIDRHELIADMLDEMETDIAGIRALAVHAATCTELYNRKRIELRYLVAPGSPEEQTLAAEIKALKWKTRQVTPLVKYLGSEKAVEAARRGIQIHGGVGYTTEYGAEKLLRDALVLPIYEGTSQIQSLMATKDALGGIMGQPARFLKDMGRAWQRSRFAGDALERRVAAIRYQAFCAQRALLMAVVKGKWGEGGVKGTLANDWNPKKDFGPALLHSEKLTRLLADAAVCEALWEQCQEYTERRDVLERYLQRCEPRCSDLLYRLQHTGSEFLERLRATERTELSASQSEVA